MIHFEPVLMLYNVMCGAGVRAWCVCVGVGGLSCARINSSRSKNTYVQVWNSIMPVLCEKARHRDGASACPSV